MGECNYCNRIDQINILGRHFYTPLIRVVISDGLSKGEMQEIEIAQDEDGYWLHYENGHEGEIMDIKISYCPMCGRKLECK